MENTKMLVLLLLGAIMVAASTCYEWKTIGWRITANNEKKIEKVLIVWWTTLTYFYAMIICSLVMLQWIICIECIALFVICVMTCDQLWRMLKECWRNKR